MFIIYICGIMKLITDVNEIREFIAKFLDITSGLLIVPGSPLRISSTAFQNWGIALNSANKETLSGMSEESYLGQTLMGEDRPDMEKLIRPKLREWVEPRMARYMGDIVKEALKSTGKGDMEISICEIPGRDAPVSSAAAMGIMFDSDTELMMRRIKFHLVDLSGDNLEAAKSNLGMAGATCETHQDLDRFFLQGIPEGSLDMIISLSHFHRKAFPDYYALIRRALKDDGILISGDRHSAVWDHPVNAYRLLQRIGAEDKTLMSLRKLFGFVEPVVGDPAVKLTSEECNAINSHFQYWEDIAAAVRQSNGGRKPRIRFLDASDTSEARRQKLEREGFTTDPAEIRKAFPRSRLDELPKKFLDGSDFAVVMVAVKKGGRVRG
jgi:hypothetical protein